MKFNRSVAAALFSTALLVGCGSTQSPAPVNSGPATSGYTTDYGTVQSIEYVGGQGQASGAGAVIGGVAGAALGNQVGSGSGRAAATVAGAVGGAVAGNAVERRRNAGPSSYRVTVLTDRGQTLTYQQASDQGLRVGDRVRIADNQVFRY